MDNDLVLMSRKAAEEVAAALRQMRRPGDPRDRKELPWAFTPGQPIPILNTASSQIPQGGFCQLTGTMDSTNFYFNVQQPNCPAIAGTLVIADAAIPAGATGLGWPMDGCVHPVYLGSLTPVVGQRYCATLNAWAGQAFGLGPVTVTQIADLVTGLPMARLHGLRGDTKMIKTGSGATAGRPVKVLWFSSNWTLTQTAPGEVTVSHS